MESYKVSHLLEPKEHDAIMKMMAALNDHAPDLLRGKKELDKMPMQNVLRGIKYYLSATDDTFSAIEKKFAQSGLKKIQKSLTEGSLIDNIDRFISEASWSEGPDDKNPDFIFQGTHTKLLLAIAAGKLDAKAAAKKELANRGLGKSGTWVGFDKAREMWK
jgi:hypothetical protein